MIRGPITHPQLLSALARSGHGTKVLIADGNYPFGTGSHPRSIKIYLNLRRGLVTVPDVLAAIVEAVPIEAAEVMAPDSGPEPEVFQAFARMLPSVPFVRRSRFDFYDKARKDDVGIVVATGEARTFANILLTIGVVE
jgi:L-fucose mutarotase